MSRQIVEIVPSYLTKAVEIIFQKILFRKEWKFYHSTSVSTHADVKPTRQISQRSRLIPLIRYFVNRSQPRAIYSNISTNTLEKGQRKKVYGIFQGNRRFPSRLFQSAVQFEP